MRPPRIHNLRGNKAERSPHRLFVWDTETYTEQEGDREVLPLRLWCAETVQRHGRRPRTEPVTEHQGQTEAELADAVEGACRASESTWAFAHNQGFDLAVTRLPVILRRRGWELTDHALTSPSPWARLARGSHRLVLVDSSSWLPGALAGIGDLVGIEKPELPREDAGEPDWWYRCRQDVRILRTALCQLLDWWDRQQLGCWSLTGPQTGFNALRHQPIPHTVVIDPDPDARALERQAITAGRREVWRVGQLPAADYVEIDFLRAHATIAATMPLPKRRSVAITSMEVDDWRVSSDRWSVLAWCSLRTDVPRYPVSFDGRVFYPTGSFRALLCGPEIADARHRGQLLDIGPGYVYQLGAHMSQWGRWVLDQLDHDDPDTPAVARTAIKGWSRTVPGKWAGRTGRVLHTGPSVEQGWHLEHGRHHPTGAPVSVLDMAGRREVVVQDQDADDAFPAVLAWIQSYVRVRLGRLVDAVGSERMVSCNTDGVIASSRDGLLDQVERADLEPLTARVKAAYRNVHVISPQHLILDRERRLSGIPASAEQVGQLQYRWMTWPRLPSQIEDGHPDGYVRVPRSADLREVPVNRWVLDDGRTLPVLAELGEDGETRIVSRWPADSWAHHPGLRPAQHPVLQALAAGE